ncbi:hypothetical protein CCACVL1_24766, partial [Corchorus capsularis]
VICVANGMSWQSELDQSESSSS